MMCDWSTVTLKEAGVTLIDCDHKTPKAQDAGFPYVGIPQLKEGHITLDGARLITEDDFHHWRRKSKPTPHDVILSRRCNPGVTAYVPEGLSIALGQNLVLLRSDGEKLYPPFLRWVVRGSNWWNQIGKFINVGAVFDSLKCADIPKFEIKLPPMDSQIKISETLVALDNKIELNRQTNQTLEQIAQAIFKSWFVDFEPVKAKIQAKQNGQDPERAAMCAISGKSLEELEQQSPETQQQLKTTAALFPDAFVESELGEIPEGWGVGIIGDLFELHRGFDLPKKDRKDGSYPVYAAGGYHGQHDEFKMEPPGIITGRSGVIGNVYLSLTKYWPLNTTLYVREFKRCGPYYAYFFLNMCDLKSINSGSAVPSLNRNFVHSMNSLIPDDSLLDVFEKFTSSSFVKIKSNDSEVELLSSLRDLLLPKLLSGDITIGDTQSVVEEVA